ncbi:M23 family metallopeptidase [Actinacidiphila paucisporea]|uniref:Peptidase family M23 n=1 Tax=Actinacidiphila paucisporea TaxID=310782 RepID=A0A1M6YM33_9ACTN|nr:M23 family metallopeptidase [Actinacidiphila paucisporea]SHL19381.1 Peptidase family M23 [Actinacidiphila paucisporea]
MASNQPAYAPSPVAAPTGEWPFGERDEHLPSADPAASPSPYDGYDPGPGPEAAGPRSQPRLPRQRSGLPARGAAVGTAVLGIAAMAAVGTGGVAAAADAPAAAPPISLPDAPGFPDALPAPAVPAAQPEVAVGTPSYDPSAVAYTAAPAEDAAAPADAAEEAPADPGEALRTRIIDQVIRQRDAAARAEREAAEKAAAEQAAKESAARKVREQAAAAKAEADAKAKAAAEAEAKAEAERLARLAASYVKPLASYTLTTAFGETGNMWATHTGQDFAAPTGTPVHAVHSGTVTSAGWAGSYGYRVVLRLDDGTELWYCHLSTMVATSGQVVTGDTIGRVGATGNVPEPHLHLEVRPGGGAPVDPVPWLYGHGVAV